MPESTVSELRRLADAEPAFAAPLRVAAARLENLEIQVQAMRREVSMMRGRADTRPLRLIKRAGVDYFVLGLTPDDPEEANNPPGLEVSFERVGDYDAFLDALPYGVRGTAPTKEDAARALLAKLQAAIADPAALFMKLSAAAGREAEEVDTDEDQLAQSEMWEAQKVWALAAGILAASSAQNELNGEPIAPEELEAIQKSVAQESLDLDPEPTP